jgi:hypothetical protein
MARKDTTPKWLLNLEDKSLPLKGTYSKKMLKWVKQQKSFNNRSEGRLRRELNEKDIGYIWQHTLAKPQENIYLIVDFMIWVNDKTIIIECNDGKSSSYINDRREKIKKIDKDWFYESINEVIENKQQAKQILKDIKNKYSSSLSEIQEINEREALIAGGWGEFNKQIFRQV